MKVGKGISLSPKLLKDNIMKVSSFKTLQLKDPRTAMIFDLTERFPRGPKAKLRAKHYKVKNQWGDNLHVPESDDLIGGDLGYDLFELYELCKKSWWNDDLLSLTVDVRDCAMGDQYYCRQTYSYIEGKWSLFKRGPQVTRRLRRLEQRLRLVREMVEKKSSANLYEVRIGSMRQPLTMFGDSETHVQQTYDLLLKAGFEQAADKKLMNRGGYYSDQGECTLNIRFKGPSHGPHEIMEENQQFVAKLRSAQEEMRAKIAELQGAISAADDLAMMVDMFTLNTCAQQFGAAE